MESLRSAVIVRMSRCGSTAEKGCLIFSIVNIIVVSTCLAACTYYVKWALDHIQGGIWGLASGIVFLFSIGLTLLALLSFVFAVLLYMGALKKRPSFLMAYFVYGIIERFIVTLFALCVLQTYKSFDTIKDERWIIAAIIINIIYCLPLIVVYQTHVRLSTENTDAYKLMNDVPLA